MDSTFIQANSSNLPEVDFFMLHNYYINNTDYMGAEISGVKNIRSTKACYGDSAIGYVQLRREASVCIIKARITPEHKVRGKTYGVTAVIDEVKSNILSCKCEDCAAALGGCKHAIAFLYWLLRRSEEPSPTSVECYWKKPTLSKVGSTLKFIKAVDLGKTEESMMLTAVSDQTSYPQTDFFKKVIETASASGSGAQILNYFMPIHDLKTLSLHTLSINYKTDNSDISSENFLKYCSTKMTELLCSKASIESSSQSKSSLWYELRYARITASKVYEAAHCNTIDGSLTEIIFGASSLVDTIPIKRGRELENEVLKVIAETCNLKIKKIGIVLNKDYPVLGASPDGISDNYVIEVKCPFKKSTLKNYIQTNDQITHKYLSQILLQMLFCKKQKGLFCIASPDFEKTKEVKIIEVEEDPAFIKNIIEKAMEYWNKAIFPVLVPTHKI